MYFAVLKQVLYENEDRYAGSFLRENEDKFAFSQITDEAHVDKSVKVHVGRRGGLDTIE